MSDEQKLRIEDDTTKAELAEIRKALADMHSLLTSDPSGKSGDPKKAASKDGGDGTDDKDWSKMSSEEREEDYKRWSEEHENAERTFEQYSQERDDDEILKGVTKVGSGLLLSGKDEDDTVFVDPEFQRFGRM